MNWKYILIGTYMLSCTEVSISKTYQPIDTAFQQDNITENNDNDENDQDYNQDSNSNQSSDTSDNSQQSDLTKTVGYVELGLMQASCPFCFGVPQEINITAYSRFHQPTGASHTSWLPQSDGCRDYYETTVSSPNVDMGQFVTLTNNFGDSYTLNQSSDPTGQVYDNNYLTESNFRRDTKHTLTAQGKTAESVLETLRGFDFIEPYTMLYVDPSYAFQTPISKYGNNVFSWGPAGDPNNFFTIHISVYSNDGSYYYGTVICRSADVGTMSIPGSYFSQYQAGNLTSIHLMRHRTYSQQYPEFGGIIEGYSWWEVIGTGFIQ